MKTEGVAEEIVALFLFGYWFISTTVFGSGVLLQSFDHH
jgi:hypothetical protein